MHFVLDKYNRYGLGELDCQCAAFEAAQQKYAESLQIFQTIGEWRDVALVRLGLARVACALGQQPTCDQHLWAAVEAVDRVDMLAGRIRVLQRLAEVLSQAGHDQEGERLRTALEHHQDRPARMTRDQEAVLVEVILGELSLGLSSG